MATRSHPTGARPRTLGLVALALALAAGVVGLLYLLGTPPPRAAAGSVAAREPAGRASAADRGPEAAADSPDEAGRWEALSSADSAQATRVGFGAQAEVASVTWTGRVLDDAEETPVPGARVVLSLGERESEALSDDEGRFEITWPAELDAQLGIEHARYVDVRAPSVDLAREGLFRLTRSARLFGYVRPVVASEEAVAALWHETASSQRYWVARECALGPDGEFEFADLEPGEYLLGARVPGRAVQPEAGLRLEPGDELQVDLEALLGARVSGRVLVAPADRGLAGVVVTAEARENDLPRDWRRAAGLETVSDATGRFVLDGLAPGAWRVSAESSWGAQTNRDLAVSEDGERLEIELSLPAAGSLGGQVVGAAGAARAGLELALFERGSQAAEFVAGEGQARTVSDAQGWFRIDEVPARSRLLLAVRTPAEQVAQGAEPESAVQPLDPLDPGQSALGLIVRVDAGQTVSGRVLSDEAVGIAGARVEVLTRLSGRTTHSARARADAEGRFEVKGLPGAGGYLRAEADGWLEAGLAVEYPAADVELRLAPALRLEGQALDSQGFAVRGIPISLVFADPAAALDTRSARRERSYASTDEYGRFTFEGLREGLWNLSGGSYLWIQSGAAPRPVQVPGESFVSLEFAPRERPQRAVIEGEVVCADGALPTGVRVEGLQGGVLTVNGGRFRASGVTPTRQRLTLRADGHAGVRLEDISLVPGGFHDVGRVLLEPATALTVRVTEKGAGAVNGARVRLAPLPVEEGGAGREARGVGFRSRSGGRYETRDATRHAWRLVVDRKGYKRVVRRIDVREQESQSVSVELEREP